MMINQDMMVARNHFMRVVAKFIAILAIACFGGCAHVTPYYEANIDGMPAITTVGCFGPSSYVSIEPDADISIMANEFSTPKGEHKVRVEVYAKAAARFSFNSGFVDISSTEFTGPISVKLEDFTADYHADVVASPTAELVIKKNSRFGTAITLPTKAREFYLQLPDARSNGTLVHLPRIHFKNATKAYIGFCEA